MLNVLQQYQSEFSEALINPQGANRAFSKKIKANPKIPPPLALEIYRNNTHGARVNALKEIFPICRSILGDKAFHSISQHYVTKDKYGAANLNNYGQLFKLHLEAIMAAGRLSTDYCYLPDLARLEFKLHAAYYADNDPVFSFESFKNKIENNTPVHLIASASLALLASQYPIYAIWKNYTQQQYISSVNAIEEKQYLLVFRERYRPTVTLISHSQYSIIDGILKNHSLQEIAENTHCEIDKVLPAFIVNKWITGVR